MPRGVPKTGFRNSKNRQATEAAIKTLDVQVPKIVETYEQADARVREVFEIMSEMGNMAIDGDCRSLIISGPPGLGKSHKIMEALKSSNCSYDIIKGTCKGTGLYRLLWKNRFPGSVLVFDDCDSVFYDQVCLNFLKAACDTTDKRTISYNAEFDMWDDDGGENIPRDFVFDGSIIFISNLDFDAMVDQGTKLAPHLAAMISRSHYIDLGLKSKRDYLIRIAHVVEDGALDEKSLTYEEQHDVISYINENSDKLRELSVRILLKVADIRSAKRTSHQWQKIANATCLRS